ncbi:MAG: phosphatase PAP2 family protein [Clostridia bacterium]|nr:phosphatase PAP2 family protein [Clostridia bacterium]
MRAAALDQGCADSARRRLDSYSPGYSYPSGHSVTAATLYGSMAVCARKMMRWISVLCVILILLTGFSRNYLGVHTPQDVLVGLTEGALMLWGCPPCLNTSPTILRRKTEFLRRES